MNEPTPITEQTEQAAAVPLPAERPGSPWVAGERLFVLFLICTALGFIGTLIGFVPLIILAMVIPVAAAAIA